MDTLLGHFWAEAQVMVCFAVTLSLESVVNAQ